MFNMIKDELIIPIEAIGTKIYHTRGQKVMLDRDLALLYEVETRALNQAVRRNLDSFPEDFMFSLTREEINNLSQFVISSKIKHAPNVFAFTEHGILMLSSVLKSKRARLVNIQIMRTFVQLRQFLATHEEIKLKLEEHDYKINSLVEAVNILLEPSTDEPKQKIGFINE